MTPFPATTGFERRALLVASIAHAATGQRRTHGPADTSYIVHPINVAALVGSVRGSSAMRAAAYLHDVVEDTHLTFDDLTTRFPANVVEMVRQVTNVSKRSDGRRAIRKAIDRNHLAAAWPEAQTIKLADIIDNLSTIRECDPVWADQYVREKALVLDVLSKGHPDLWNRAKNIISDYWDDRRTCIGRETPTGISHG